MTTAPLCITIPVHDEKGWSASSPDELPVKARLEKSATAKSPEELHKAEKHAELVRLLDCLTRPA